MYSVQPTLYTKVHRYLVMVCATESRTSDKTLCSCCKALTCLRAVHYISLKVPNLCDCYLLFIIRCGTLQPGATHLDCTPMVGFYSRLRARDRPRWHWGIPIVSPIDVLFTSPRPRLCGLHRHIAFLVELQACTSSYACTPWLEGQQQSN
jgi:hypothetical protein